MTAKQRALASLCASLCLVTGAGHASEDDLVALDLETLMTMDATIVSAARREQSSADAAAAVYVLTREDIRRSGVTTLPDALRLVPGLQVSRIATRTWAVSTRGFNSRFSNKLQVLIDGRSIYAAIFSGVLWEEQPISLDEIERVEVIRGPGGALWGINAMNGVINVITRDAAQARGLHLSGSGGSESDATATMRYGALLGEAGELRIYADRAERDGFENDLTELDQTQIGFRFDRELTHDHFTVRGDYAESEFGDPSLFSPASALPASARAGNIGAEWRRAHADQAQTELNVFHAWTDRGSPNRWDETMTGLDLQHTMARHGRHLLTYGAGYRRVTDAIRDPATVLLYSKSSLEQHQWSVYAQDEIFFLEDRARLIAGAKLEDFKYTGIAFQPTLRLIWRAREEHALWSAVSRAARSPSRFELHSHNPVPVAGPGGAPMTLLIQGNEDVDAEQLDAYELGWRWRPEERFGLELALFHHDYAGLLVQSARTPIVQPGMPPQITLPLQFDNDAAATSEGAELTLEWRPSERLRLQGGGRWLDLEVQIAPGASQAFANEPQHAWYARARLDLPRAVELDLSFNAVGDIKGHARTSYETLDVLLGWTPIKGLHLALGAQNVFDDEHIEYVDILTGEPGVTLGRSIFGRIMWRPGI